jgi:hypothetical protein
MRGMAKGNRLAGSFFDRSRSSFMKGDQHPENMSPAGQLYGRHRQLEYTSMPR